jgi:TrmH family RNA methyltransferase
MGTAVRACRNFGALNLRVLQPGAWSPRHMAIAAPRSEDWIARHVHCAPDLEHWVEGLDWLVAVTGRPCVHHEVSRDPAEVARAAQRHASRGIGWVFGREDTGLTNDIIDRCDAVLTLPTEADYPSMNLAQAVTLCLYEANRAVREVEAHRESPAASPAPGTAPAEHAQRERFSHDLFALLDAAGYFKGSRTGATRRALHRLIQRFRPDPQELALLWGIVTELRRHRPAHPTSDSP